MTTAETAPVAELHMQGRRVICPRTSDLVIYNVVEIASSPPQGQTPPDCPEP